MYNWLKKDGFISHRIGFSSHGLAKEWNGHWKYSDLMWKLIRGKRPYLINREPLSTHLKLMSEEGFKIRNIITSESPLDISRRELSHRFKNISNDDLITSSAFIQASKL